MVCKHLLLPALAMGLALYAPETSARNAHLLNSAQPNQQHLRFVENKGQIVNQHQKQRHDIDFRLSAGNGLNVFIGSGEIHYQWAKPIEASGHGKLSRTAGHELGASEKQMDAAPAYEMYRMDVSLIGANPNATVITAEQQSFYERYYLPGVGANGAIAHAFHKITYKNVYPNIDWVLYVKSNTVEYDFVIRPGGKVSDIKLKYGGATTFKVNSGNLVATTPLGSISEKAPYSFQEDGKTISSKFILKDNTLSFDVAEYSGTLTIDPTLEWGTYFGDSGDDVAYGISHDANENIYITGITSSIANIATNGSYQVTLTGSSDAFLTKFNTSGNCIWATYFGGTGADRGTDIALDGITHNLYMAGITNSGSGIATTAAHQDTLGGSYDVFLAKFDTSGARVWATYYGGSGSDGAGLIAGVACDKNSNIFLSGETKSDNNIITAGAYQSARNGGTDAFIAKFDSSGVRQWATYFGGSGEDHGRKVGCDTSGNVYLGGYTNSSSDIATSGAYQPTFGGLNDAFIAKFNTSGTLQWATYFGGSATEVFNALTVSPEGTTYIGGTTGSGTGIATPGVYQDTLAGGMDGFLAAFSNTGQLSWATYIGGPSTDVINSVTQNGSGIYSTGMTNSISGISSPGSYQPALSAGLDGFIFKVNNIGQNVWGTYYGGAGGEYLNAITITGTQNLYIAGQTNSAADIATNGSFQPAFGGGSYDMFLLLLNVCEPPQQPGNITGDTIACSGQEYIYQIDPVPGANSYTWILPNGWIGSSDSTSINIIAGNTDGTIYVMTNNSCASSDSTALDITVHPSPEPSIVQNGSVLNTTMPFSSYQWNKNDQAINGATSATYLVTTDGSYSVTVTNDNGCSGTSDTLQLTGLGIDELQTLQASIHVYPNPTADVVNIQSPIPVNVNIVSIEGRLQLSVEGAKSINLKNLAAGLYLMRIFDKNKRLIKVVKVVKKER